MAEEDQKLIYPLGLMAPETRGEWVAGVGAQPSPNVDYLSYTYNGAPVVLVGVSADNTCHFIGPHAAQCNFGTGDGYGINFKPFINDLVARGLNSLRLWVSIAGGEVSGDPKLACQAVSPVTAAAPGSPPQVTNDNPFQYAGIDSLNQHQWYLNVRDEDYFNRLAAVVSYADTKGVIVEVTLFSPLTGLIGVGPYGKGHALLKSTSPSNPAPTLLAGFTDSKNFTDADSAEYGQMAPYILNVIKWTVDKLHTFPNVYYEVANEPESLRSSDTYAAGCGKKSATVGATVAKWQKTIAGLIRSYETSAWVSPPGSTLARPHLIAVEPSTISAANTFFAGGANAGAGEIINSHYTVFNPQAGVGLPGDGLGAIVMVRKYNSQPKIFGFNETKITGGACISANTAGSVEAGRAEAWEFMLGQGGIYNQFGYDCSGVHSCTNAQTSSDAYCKTRAQMGVLRKFLTDPLVNVVTKTKTSMPVANGTPWINVGPYEGSEFSSTSKKFWAAIEPTSTASNKRWLLYVHHSLRRGLPQDAYKEIVRVAPNERYQEKSLSVCLLGAPAGAYYVRWYTQPDIAVASAPSRIDTITWPAPANCIPGGAGAVPLRDSDVYNYDLALLISK